METCFMQVVSSIIRRNVILRLALSFLSHAVRFSLSYRCIFRNTILWREWHCFELDENDSHRLAKISLTSIFCVRFSAFLHRTSKHFCFRLG
jgi:hypothetical protein